MNQVAFVMPLGLAESDSYVGLNFENRKALGEFFRVLGEFFRVECPCGIFVILSINDFPQTSLKHPCGKPNHWTVKYDSDESMKSADDIMAAVRAMGKGTR